MSTIIYDGEIHAEIWTREVLISQLERALSILKTPESELTRVEIAQIMIEVDHKEQTLAVIV